MSEIWSKVNKNIPSYVRKYRNIAVVGLSAEPDRPSYKVSEYMKYQGYNIIHVNPKYDELFGNIYYKRLKDIGKLELMYSARKPKNYSRWSRPRSLSLKENKAEFKSLAGIQSP